GALVAHHLADESALEGGLGFRHWDSLGLGGFRTLLRQDGLGASDVTARGTQRGGVVELLRGLLHAQAEMGLLQALHFGFHAGGVLGTEILGFRHVLCSSYWPIMRETNVVRSGSLAAASLNASRASSSGAATISYS